MNTNDRNDGFHLDLDLQSNIFMENNNNSFHDNVEMNNSDSVLGDTTADSKKDAIRIARLAGNKTDDFHEDTDQEGQELHKVTGLPAILSALMNRHGKKALTSPVSDATSPTKAYFNHLEIKSKHRDLLAAKKRLEESSAELINHLRETGNYDRVMAEIKSGAPQAFISELRKTDVRFSEMSEKVQSELTELNETIKDSLFLFDSTEVCDLNREAFNDFRESIKTMNMDNIEDSPLLADGRFKSLKEEASKLIEDFKEQFDQFFSKFMSFFSRNTQSSSPRP